MQTKIPWYKYFLSYFYLVTVKELPSKINPGLCIQMEAGRLLLNTENANYSYGNLHKVFEEVFDRIDIENNPPKNVLILGLGSGSVIDILQRQYGFNPKITAVEIDSEIVKALSFWNQLDLSNTSVIEGDAFEIISNLESGFDLIIVDLFIDLDAHPKILETHFIDQISFLLAFEGTILINFVVNTKLQKENFAEFQLMLMKYFKEIVGHEVMGMNRVLQLKKT